VQPIGEKENQRQESVTAAESILIRSPVRGPRRSGERQFHGLAKVHRSREAGNPPKWQKDFSRSLYRERRRSVMSHHRCSGCVFT